MRRIDIQMACRHCLKMFLTKPHVLNQGKGIFCSKSCAIGYRMKDKPNYCVKGGITSSSFKKGHIVTQTMKDKISIAHKGHKRGVTHGLSYTKEYAKTMKARSKAKDRDLSIKTVQLVYEANIKKFGSLTCYLCLKPIEFGKDNLEHKVPIIRGGTNDYENLAVAHQLCNFKKSTKTDIEYLAHISAGQ